MLTRRAVLRIPLLSVLPGASRAAETAVRRALVVGIDKYVPTPPIANAQPAAGGSALSGPSTARTGLFDLDGAVNDATLIYHLLIGRFGFQAQDIVFLRNEQATRARILAEFKRHLVDSAAKGDVSLFYYAGHGSQVRNLASDEGDQLDETLVPADANTGVRDIRDKEMARLYRAALEKGVALTVVLDSCHSGGMSRGIWNSTGKTRFTAPDPRPVTDADRDPATGKKAPDAATLGMLFLAAAREDQTAGETTVTERGSQGTREVSHGAFTAALARVLNSPLGGESVAQICERVEAILASEGKQQSPACAGEERQTRGLLRQPAGLGAALTVAVDGIEGSLVRLRGGSALGLAAGCTLARTTGPAVRLELTRVELAESQAKLPAGISAGAVKAGDLFKLESWAAPPDSAIRLYYPKDGPGEQAVMDTARAIAQVADANGARLLTDPAAGEAPTHVIYWRNAEYMLERYPASGDPVRLGASPTRESIAAALAGAGEIRLWPILPPSRQLSGQLAVLTGTQNAAVRVVDDPAQCVYFAAGRLQGDALEYAWVFKDAMVADPDKSRYPLRTDWQASGAELTALAVRLGRVYAWLNLDGPVGGDSSFPYKLVFENADTGRPRGAAPVKIGERYKFVLEADAKDLKRGEVLKHYVYIFLIDSTGQGTCLFPDPSNGNDGNLIPRGDDAPLRVEVSRKDSDLDITAPAGTDNYFLLASREPIDPDILQWSGVRTRALRGNQTPLEFLFSSVGTGTQRGLRARAVPVTWSIQSMAVRCVP